VNFAGAAAAIWGVTQSNDSGAMAIEGVAAPLSNVAAPFSAGVVGRNQGMGSNVMAL